MPIGITGMAGDGVVVAGASRGAGEDAGGIAMPSIVSGFSCEGGGAST
jgi:hypothetical protein